MEYDFGYLCDNLGHLSGLHTRVFKHDILIKEYNAFPIGFDMENLLHAKIFGCSRSVAFYEAADVLIFGKIYIENMDIRIIIGPTMRVKPTNAQKRAILRELGEPLDAMSSLSEYFSYMVNYPLENFLQILCFVNYALNGEKTVCSELLEQHVLGGVDNTTHIGKAMPSSLKGIELHNDEDVVYNTYETERKILSCIRAGNTRELKRLLNQPPTGRTGKVAHDELRQQKNRIIIMTTLASRAAITGGMPHELAFALSDQYIRKAELMDRVTPLAYMLIQMMLDFAKRVEQTKHGGANTSFTKMVNYYAAENIGNKMSLSDIAASLGYSRSYICERFKKETGKTLNEYITARKIDEAKRLLESSGLSISQISAYLGFSSQSYFQNIFKKKTGTTPMKYREFVYANV